MTPPPFKIRHVDMYAWAVDFEDETGSSWASAEKPMDGTVDVIVWHEQWYDHPKGAAYVASQFKSWAAQEGIRYKLANGRY